MTIYCEDPHDTWHESHILSSFRASYNDHAGRDQTWLGMMAGLAVFYTASALAFHSVL